MGPLGISHLVGIPLLWENKTVAQENLPVFIDPEDSNMIWVCSQGEYLSLPHTLKSQLPKSAIRLIPKASPSSATLCASPNPDGIWFNTSLADRMETSENDTCLPSSLYTFGLISSPLIKSFGGWQKLMTSRSADRMKYFQWSLHEGRHPAQF